METKSNTLWWTVVAVMMAFVLLASHCSQSNQQAQQQHQTQSVLAATVDSVRYYRDRYGREVAEKSAMEADMKTLEAQYAVLSRNQKALVQDVKHLPRGEQRGLVAAASVVQTVTIHDHVNIDSTRIWTLDSDSLRYHIRTLGDTLHVDSLTIPNRVLVTTYRDAENNVHVTATNTNPMLKTNDVDAILPPDKKPNPAWKWVALVAAFLGGVLVAR